MKTLRAFLVTRRSAVAVIMAVSLVPLVLLVGIAVDITFLSQSRTQNAFAAQASATQATRIAAATYQYETNYLNQTIDGQTMTQTLAAQDAINAGNAAGNLWYPAEAGTLDRATDAPASTNTTYDGGTNGTINTSTPPNFQAQVTDTATYPPIFNPLFGRNTNWVYKSGATATTQFKYAQILLMLDTSGSMLIGADPPDIAALEQASICPSSTWLNPSQPPSEGLFPAEYQTQAVDNDAVVFPNTFNASTNNCVSNHGYNGTTAAGTPCALACHSSSTPSPAMNGYSADYYGMARYLGLTLRIDVLFQATEQVIQDMETSEAVANQLSVGVYNFSTDSFPIVTGSSSDALPEATTNLAAALQNVENDDGHLNPSETAVPQLINYTTVSTTPSQTVANIGGDTDFPLSLRDLESGNPIPVSSGGHKQPLTASGSGSTVGTPEKFMFIVTDGMEDDSTSNGGPISAEEGQMTSINAEAANTGVCSFLKDSPTGTPAGLGYTVYVLYVDYYPLASSNYYTAPTPGGRNLNSYTTSDGLISAPASDQTLSEVTSEAGQPNDAEYKDAPIAKALAACASNTSDFYEANNSSSIKTALDDMLKSALASTIRLTN